MRAVSVCIVIVVLAVNQAFSSAPFPSGTVYTGSTTYFATGGTGSCQYASSNFDQNALEVVALSASQFEAAVHCGECINITSVNGSIIATIVDSSPGIGTNNLSVSYYAFTELGGQGYVPIPISWYSVPCPTFGGLVIHTDVGVQDGYYIAFQPVNFKIPITLMETKVNGIYKTMTFQSYNIWTLSTGTDLKAPFNIRVTAYTGEQITVTMTALTADSNQCINQQFAVANPTTGSTTSDLLLSMYCNDTSDFPVGLTTDGNTPGASSGSSASTNGQITGDGGNQTESASASLSYSMMYPFLSIVAILFK